MPDPKVPNFNESQTAIFNFLFVLIDQYKASMPGPQAVDKACDWLISLAEDVKAKNKDFAAEQAANKQKLSENM